MSAFVKTIRKPSGIVIPLDQVKRQAIVDALDKCSGNYCLAAQLLGIGRTTIYRMARMYNYRPPAIQAERLMTVSQRTSSPAA
jgi:transcriptional regulator of acetoin/glycerol metabolism